jgi:hypothetical protein
MMIPERPALERRVLAALDGTAGTGRRIPVVLGGCGTGRSSLLLRLRDLIGKDTCQFVDVERIATTPERSLKLLRDASPFKTHTAHGGNDRPTSDLDARESFDRVLAFLDSARAPGNQPATFLLDEFLEWRTFESFPGLRTVLKDLINTLAASENRFVMTSRYTARSLRLLRDASAQFEIMHVTPLSAAEIRSTLPATADGKEPGSVFREDEEDRARDELARLVQSLSDGRPAYAHLIADMATANAARGAVDPVSALTALLAPGGQLANSCKFSYELRLHRARGYGALKAILEVLSEEEPLTLTEIATRLRRTPGSTKDYLSWLEDVDLIGSRHKRYSFTDPMLRLWVRLHCRQTPPGDDDIAREVHGYVMSRLPQSEPALALAAAGQADAGRTKNWGIIEID